MSEEPVLVAGIFLMLLVVVNARQAAWPGRRLDREALRRIRRSSDQWLREQHLPPYEWD